MIDDLKKKYKTGIKEGEAGEIDLTKSAEEIYNFIRAQSSPYPGAYIKTKDGEKIIIEKAKIK